MGDYAHLRYAGLTDIGKVRELNEDSILCLPEVGLFCVADGVGGGEAGHVASGAMVDALQKLFEDLPDPGVVRTVSGKARLIRRTTNQVSQWIREKAVANGFSGTGTTVVIMCFDATSPERAIALHAGDSCVYRYREGELLQLTRNHSYAEIHGVGDPALLPPSLRGIITRAVGVTDEVDLEETEIDVRPDDLYVVCSDGLYGMVPPARLAEMLGSANGTVDDTARQLIDAANDAGGRDNVSVIVIRADELPELEIEEDDEDSRNDTQDLFKTI